MGIDKVIRTYSEKTTSVDQEIEVVQYLRLGVNIKRAAYSVVFPTNVKVPKSIHVTPMTVSSAQFLHDGWYATLTMVEATNSVVSTALILPGTNSGDANAVDGPDYLRIYGRNLYISLAAMTAAQAASASTITGSTALWKKVDSIGSNAKKYLYFTPDLATTASYASLGFAIEVRGYGVAE